MANWKITRLLMEIATLSMVIVHSKLLVYLQGMSWVSPQNGSGISLKNVHKTGRSKYMSNE